MQGANRVSIPSPLRKESIMPVLAPDEYGTLTPSQLLEELAAGRVGFDHYFLKSFLRELDVAVAALNAFTEGDHQDDPVDIEDQIFDLYRHLRAPDAVPFYLLLLRSQLDGVREELIEAFAELGADSVEPLLELYEQLEEDEAGEVAFVLAALQSPDSRITAVLLDRLQFDAQDAAICLGIHGDPAAGDALRQLLDEVKDKPEAALLKSDLEETLARLQAGNASAAREPFDIYEHYDEFQPPFFEAMEPEEAFQWFASSDVRVRLAVAESIDEDNLSAEVAGKLLQTTLDEGDLAVRCALWRSLLPAEATPNLLDAVKSRMQADGLDSIERATLLILLSKLEYSPVVKSEILDAYGDPSLRALALEAAWYTADSELLPLVQESLEDDDVAVRRAAILGVGFFVDSSSAPRLIPAMKVEDLRVDAIYSYALAHPGEVSRLTAQKVLRHVEQIAGQLNQEETEVAMSAIDLRLGIQGIRPYFASTE
jgi:hypothetical protein